MREADRKIGQDNAMRQKLQSKEHFEGVVVAVVRKGYMISSNAEATSQKDAIHKDKTISTSCTHLWESIGAKKKMHLTYAMEMIRDFETPSGIVAKLSEVCDRAHRCMSAKNQAFVMVVTHGYNLSQANITKETSPGVSTAQSPAGPDSTAGPTVAALQYRESEKLIEETLKAHLSATSGNSVGVGEFSGALSRVYECVECFLDSHKEKAFQSAFIEPARFYFDLVGDSHQRDHVNIHGINWYLALLHGGLGIQLPLLSAYSDGDNIGVCDFWKGLSDNAWKEFAKEANFGKAFEGIKAFEGNNRQKFKGRNVTVGELPQGLRSAKAMLLGNSSTNNGRHAKALALYLGRYAYFFRRDWLTRRMFENLNSESLPEYIGFRKACEVLYASYPLREANKESFIEFVYADEYFTELDETRVGEFFEWILVFRGSAGWAMVENAAGLPTQEPTSPGVGVWGSVQRKSSLLGVFHEQVEGRETCPICMEEKDDIEKLDHWMPQGDVSEHKMCGACKAEWEKQEKMECPFCRELLHADEMSAFIKDAVAAINHQDQMSPDEAAAIMEQWQMIEMMLQGQQKAIVRIAKLVVEHKDFVASIVKGTSGKCRWLRDMAGVVFRLDSMYKDGELKVPASKGKMLADAVEAMMTPIEGSNAAKLDPHFYGALYTQAVTPWLCAWRGGASTKTAAEHVRRAGRVIVHGVRKHKIDRKAIQQRLVEDYVQLAHEPVWGGQQEDVLYQTVYKGKK
mmetsp:Transcript_32549/g.82022  ORF Transcript_32549/g.82022 Transcript_32549/m.82022 type:complete len:741 (-) Transcript_32549:269-2491(-)